MQVLYVILLIVLGMADKKNIRNNLLVGQSKTNAHLNKTDTSKLYVHLIPHSHDDVGWLKTYEEYYYGLNNRVQWAGIQYTIDSVIRSLFFDSTKKFIQVEVAFFKIWWDDQNEEVRNKTKYLIKRGQLEFINGGWCMNDEATAYYEDIIDQMTLGHKFLFETFTVQPTIGWQIDPFGHTNTQALFSHLMGFNAWFFSRIDYQDMAIRKENKQMEMVMTPQNYPIFTHVNYNHYEAPPQFSFDTINQAESIVDNPKSQYFNVDKRAQVLVDYFKEQSKAYQGNVLMHTLGSDFAWSNAPMYYKNIDRLLKYINEHKEFNVNIFYSTPSEYLSSINYEQLEYPTKSDDFLPYADRVNGYWTGYFTSRVAFKLFIKQTGRYAQIIRRFVTTLILNGKSQYLSVNRSNIMEAQNILDEALATNQHHDAVTGTAKQKVTDDYIDMLSNGIWQMNNQMNEILFEIVQFELQEQEKQQFFQCNYNISSSECNQVYEQLMNDQTIQLNLVDSKEQSYKDYIRIKVPNKNYTIYDQDNKIIKGDLLCLDNLDKNNCDLYFIYQRNPKLLLEYFKISSTQNEQFSVKVVSPSFDLNDNPNPLNYTPSNLITLNNSKPFTLSYQYYESSIEKQQSSGAYIFRPKSENEDPIEFGTIKSTQLYSGQIMEMIVLERDNLKTYIKNFNHQIDTYEIETYVHELPVEDKIGKELIMKINTQVQNKDLFYTDSSGMHLQRRKLNFRETWNLTVHQPISGNYYPINGVFLIENEETHDAAAIINDRCQGATSLREGEIEIMIHRRILKDDARGVGEPLNEQIEYHKGLNQYFQHTLTFFNKAENPNQHRTLQYLNDLKPIIYFSKTNKQQFQEKVKSFRITFPRDIEKIFNPQSLTKYYLQYWNQDQYLYRIHNMNEVQNSTLPQLEQFNIVETTLTGNQMWTEWQKNRLRWKLQQGQVEPEVTHDSNVIPQQIRTFFISKNNN